MLAGKNTLALFNALAQHVGVDPDRDGEVWLACPNCGKKSKHFSFSVRGAKCFACGFKATLAALADKVGLPDRRPYAAPVEAAAPPKPPKPWQARALELALNYAQAPGAAQAWHAYKRLSLETRVLHMLGLGVLPACACRHPRLIVPLFRGADVTGFRGRRINCNCEQKWISPAGTKLTLYNAESIRPGEPVVIVENPVDALLIGERLGKVAVATLGVTIWGDGYFDQVRPASKILIAFDNDVAGNLHTPAAIAAYQATHQGHLPALGGPTLYNKFVDAKFTNMKLFDWAGYPEGADWGDIL